jgi:translocation and assembly module TamB
MMSADTKRRSLVGFPLLGFLLRLSGQLLLLLLLLVGFVLGTQTGLRTAIGIAEEFAPEMISVGRAEGRVLGELSIADLTLDLPGLALRLGSLHLDWQPGALLTGKLRVTDLAIADVDVVVEPSDEPPPPKEPAELPEIKLPIGIDIERVLVERLSFSQAGAPPESAIRLTRAELSATALADAVDLRRLMVEMAQPEATANATGNATLSGDYPLNLDLDWRFSQPPALVVEGDGTVSGTLAELLVEHRVSGIAELTLDATLSDVLEEPAWTAEILLEQVDLPAIAPDAPPIDLNASLRSSGSLARAEVTGTLNASAPDLPDVGALSAELDLLWSEQRLTLNRVGLDETQSGGTLELTGFLDLSDDAPTFDIEGAWERLRWPLTGVAVVDAPLGRLDVKGGLEAFDYSLAAEVFGEQIPETEMTLTGTASAEATEIEELLVETLDGRIEVRGNVAWAPAVTWDIAVNASDLDPGAQWAGLDGLVTLKADSGGGLEDGYRFDANLNADVAAYPGLVLNVAGEGDLTKASLTKLSVETLAGLIDGGGEVAWDPTLTWDFALTANDLNPGDHYEGLDGRIGFKLSTSGGLEDGFAYLLQGSAAVADYPPATVDVSGLGTAEATELERFAVEVLDGRIDGAGRVAWAPELSWDTRLRLERPEPRFPRRGLAGRTRRARGDRRQADGRGTGAHRGHRRVRRRSARLSGSTRRRPGHVRGDDSVDGVDRGLRRHRARRGGGHRRGEARSALRLRFAGSRHPDPRRWRKPRRRWSGRRQPLRTAHPGAAARARRRGEWAGHRTARR